MNSYAQTGQDTFVASWFAGKRDGVFVEVGAYDGETLSNTLLFEEELGWTGLCIEPNPEAFQKLSQRRKCHAVCCGVGESTGSIPFIQCTGQMGTLSANKDVFNRARWERLSKKGDWPSETVEIVIPIRRTQDILDEFSLSKIDFLSVDTDGSEISVLKGIDWSRTAPSLVMVEDIDNTAEIHKFMQSQGYTSGCGLDWDYCFWKP